MKVYPVGYAAPNAMERVQQLLTDTTTYLVDIRKRRLARFRPQWNKNALINRFGAQYVYVPELGNNNYKLKDRHKGIEFVDADAGVSQLVARLMQGQKLVLLCACQDYEHCHRRVVVDLLRERMPEVEIVLEKEMKHR